MKTLGPLLFALGVGVAISAGAKLPEDGATWPTTLPIFVVALAIGVAGVVMWHLQVRAHASTQDAQRTTSALSYLEGFAVPARELSGRITGLSAEQICAEVDRLLLEYIHPFAEGRQQVIRQLGMEKGAELLICVAYGERMLNRTWTAAADGHLEEALSSYPEALEAFDEAARLVG